MLRAYNSPGVTVTEVNSLPLAPLLPNPSVICIVGSARGYQHSTERSLLSGTNAVPLRYTGVINNSLVVRSAVTGETVNPGAYTLVQGADPDTTQVGDEPWTIARRAAPATAPTVAASSSTAATLTTNLTGLNNDLLYTAVTPGVGGNSITIEYNNPGTPSAALGVVVTANAIRVNLATSAGSAITSTASQVATAIAGSGPASALVTVANAPGNDGTGVVTALAPTALSGGTSAGNLTGTYRYAVSFLNTGGETGIGPKSTTVVLTNQGANLSAIPVGPGGSGTTARNIYRSKVVGGVDGPFNLVATINDNTVSTLSNETTSDVIASTGPLPKVGIADGDSIILDYDYTDQHYYEPTILDSYDDLRDKYGDPVDADGNISSKLTFAARLVFENGAGELVALASKSDGDQDIADALSRIEDEESVRIIVPISGDPAVHSALLAHVTMANARGFYRQMIIGRDGTGAPVSADLLRLAAKAYNDEAVSLISPANFIMQNPVTRRQLNVGGQYVAAAVAGMFAARDVQVSLTRKTLASIVGVNDRRTLNQTALDSAAGLFVIEDRGGVIRIRHSITTAVADVNKREVSVVRAKYDMAHRLRDALDATVIGIVVSVQEAPLMVESVVTGILEQLLLEGSISLYANVAARVLLESDPTTVECRFQYIPAYPINNVDVRFTINTQSGEFSLDQAA